MFSPGFQRAAAYLLWGIFGMLCYLIIAGGPHSSRWGVAGSVIAFSAGTMVGHFAMALWKKI
jgi:dipeptide/tripeptide permease